MNKKKIIITVLALVLVCFSACGKKEAASNPQEQLTGKWDFVEQSPKKCPSIQNIRYNNISDNKLELFGDGSAIADGESVKWIAENGRLKIGSDVSSYELSDNKLKLIDDDGCERIYERK